MTQEQIIEGNELIKQFVPEFTLWTKNGLAVIGGCKDINSLYFHSSWDWLMPVVRKIVVLCIEDGDELFLSDQYTSILDTIPLAVIEDSWKVIVEFIKWYNENNSKKEWHFWTVFWRKLLS